MRTLILFVALAIASSVFAQSPVKPVIRQDVKFACLQKIADESQTATSTSVSNVEDVASLIHYYAGLSTEVRSAIDKCGLNLDSAMKRCENVHGKGKCTQITSTFVNRECPKGWKNEGCCQCAVECPEGWKNKGYWCMKPEATVLTKYKTEKDCQAKEKKCEKIADDFFVSECPKMHQRIGGNICLAECPLGWNDQGPRCQKPANFHIGHLFAWTNGDN